MQKYSLQLLLHMIVKGLEQISLLDDFFLSFHVVPMPSVQCVARVSRHYSLCKSCCFAFLGTRYVALIQRGKKILPGRIIALFALVENPFPAACTWKTRYYSSNCCHGNWWLLWIFGNILYRAISFPQFMKAIEKALWYHDRVSLWIWNGWCRMFGHGQQLCLDKLTRFFQGGLWYRGGYWKDG